MKRIAQQLIRAQSIVDNVDPDDDTVVHVKQRTPQRCSNCQHFKKDNDHDPKDCTKCTNREDCPTDFDNGHPAALAAKRLTALKARMAELEAKETARAKERERRKVEKETKEREKKAKRERAAEGKVSAPSLVKFLNAAYVHQTFVSTFVIFVGCYSNKDQQQSGPLVLQKMLQQVRQYKKDGVDADVFVDANIAPPAKRQKVEVKTQELYERMPCFHNLHLARVFFLQNRHGDGCTCTTSSSSSDCPAQRRSDAARIDAQTSLQASSLSVQSHNTPALFAALATASARRPLDQSVLQILLACPATAAVFLKFEEEQARPSNE